MSKSEQLKNKSILKSSSVFQSHPTLEELYAMGKSLRDKCPHESHAAWQPADHRVDPIILMERANNGRICIALTLFVVTVIFLGTMPICNDS